jgi:hypothetical protein
LLAAREGRDDGPGCVTRTNATADALSSYHGRPRSTARSPRSSPRHFLPQILQGNSAPRQRAAGQIPLKRMGDLNEAPADAADEVADDPPEYLAVASLTPGTA